MDYEIVQLQEDDWKRHRAIRLEALRTAQDMYSTRYEDMVDKTEQWWRSIMSRNRYVYAEKGNDIAGLAGLSVPTGDQKSSKSHEDKGIAFTEMLPHDAGMLISVFVADRARGNGLGRSLSEAILEIAGQKGVRDLYLDVAEHNRHAQDIYLSLGFSFTGIARPTDCLGATHEERQMKKRIS